MVRALERYIRPGVKSTPFCPGCGHGILMGLILRAIDELKMEMSKMVFVSGIGFNPMMVLLIGGRAGS